MMALVLGLGSRVLSSRVGLVAVVCAALWGLHVVDKSRAVNAARDGYVQQVELAAARAELAELRRRAAVAAEANVVLQEKVQVAEGEALRFAAELEEFEGETEINPDGIVDADILRRLRSN